MTKLLLAITFLLNVAPSMGLEVTYSDEERTKLSSCVLIGEVIEDKYVRKLKGAYLWKATVRIDAIIKKDGPLKETVNIYYAKGFRHKRDTTKYGGSSFPNIKKGTKAKFFCIREKVRWRGKVLFVQSNSWISEVDETETEANKK